MSKVVEGLRDRGHVVDTLSRADAPELHLGEFRFSALPTRWLRLERLVDGYDVVNLHGPAPFVSDAFLVRSRLGGRSVPPIAYTHHFLVEIDGWERACGWYNRAHRRLNQYADRLIVTTDSYRRMMETASTPPIDVIPWGIDTGRFAGSTPSTYTGDRPLRVLFVGQMRPYKGVPTLLEAADRCGGLELTLVGSGPRLDEYRAHGERLVGVRPRFAGSVDDEHLNRLFLDSDVVVLPSRNRLEAFGLVLLEAMAAGSVPVASALPGVDDVVGPAGVLVPPGDAGALADALRDLAEDPGRTAELQEAATERVGRFGWEQTIGRYEEVLADLAGSGRRPLAARRW